MAGTFITIFCDP